MGVTNVKSQPVVVSAQPSAPKKGALTTPTATKKEVIIAKSSVASTVAKAAVVLATAGAAYAAYQAFSAKVVIDSAEASTGVLEQIKQAGAGFLEGLRQNPNTSKLFGYMETALSYVKDNAAMPAWNYVAERPVASAASAGATALGALLIAKRQLIAQGISTAGMYAVALPAAAIWAMRNKQ